MDYMVSMYEKLSLVHGLRNIPSATDLYRGFPKWRLPFANPLNTYLKVASLGGIRRFAMGGQ